MIELFENSTACSLNAKTDNEISDTAENPDTSDTNAVQTASADYDKVYSSDSKALFSIPSTV